MRNEDKRMLFLLAIVILLCGTVVFCVVYGSNSNDAVQNNENSTSTPIITSAPTMIVATATPMPTITPTPTMVVATATPMPPITPTPTMVVVTATPMPTITPTPTITPVPNGNQGGGNVEYVTPAPTATLTPTPVPTATPTVVPTATPTVTPTVVPTATPTVAPTETTSKQQFEMLKVEVDKVRTGNDLLMMKDVNQSYDLLNSDIDITLIDRYQLFDYLSELYINAIARWVDFSDWSGDNSIEQFVQAVNSASCPECKKFQKKFNKDNCIKMQNLMDAVETDLEIDAMNKLMWNVLVMQTTQSPYGSHERVFTICGH